MCFAVYSPLLHSSKTYYIADARAASELHDEEGEKRGEGGEFATFKYFCVLKERAG